MITAVTAGELVMHILRSLGLGTASGDWKVTHGLMPSEEPVQRMAVMDTSPIQHGKDPDGTPSEHLGVQIVFRSKTRTAGWVKARQVVKRLLQAKATSPFSVSLNSVQYSLRHAVLASGPVYVTTEEWKDVEVHTANLLLVITEDG